MLKLLLIPIALTLMAASCDKQPIPTVVCPPGLKAYTQEQQRQAAAEIRQLQTEDKAPILRGMIVDYRALRARLESVNCRPS